MVNQSKIIRISGTVKDAADRPIKDVDVVVDGTPYAAKTINDGSFNIPIPGYHFGDRITLVTSHPAYEDKIKEFDIESGEIDKIEFVLNPLPPETILNTKENEADYSFYNVICCYAEHCDCTGSDH